MADPNDISGRQFAAARVLLRMSVERLARLTGLDDRTIQAVEDSRVQPAGPAEAVAAMCTALENSGIRFIPDNGGGEGVRLKFSRSESRRLATLEGEGGIVAEDDV
ncbi:XRE family transcriptional regulator [Chelativorans sp. ZYF759]|uniref:XRE family transcriptional regulator n=1 Tax=Chelativorans sp. ZYF759 TaxID=2692213 RepID=UPI00145DA881|nr:XRE family transcriptional regulator [Chelativorans sp. ZYF759]